MPSSATTQSRPALPPAAADLDIPSAAAAAMLARPPALLADRPTLRPLPAVLHRLLRRRGTLLVWSRGLPRPWQLPQRAALHLADIVLTSDEATAEAVAARHPAATVLNMPGPYRLDGFLDQPPRREGEAAHRIVVCGPLRPAGNALHILHSAASWAERHSHRRIEIRWIGGGDLRGVLAAQPLPPNLLQSFSGPMEPDAVAAEFGRCGILIDGLAHDENAHGPFAEAMAGGLVVVFDRHRCVDGTVLEHGASGIAFDGHRPDGLLAALAEAMDRSPDALDAIRREARSRIRRLRAGDFERRLVRTIETILGGRAAARSRRAVAAPIFAPSPVADAG